MQVKTGLAARRPRNLNLPPTDAVTDSGTESLGRRLLGREADRKALGGIALAQAIGLLRRGKDTIQKTGAEANHGLLDARNFDEIDSGADYHSAYTLQHFHFLCFCPFSD